MPTNLENNTMEKTLDKIMDSLQTNGPSSKSVQNCHMRHMTRLKLPYLTNMKLCERLNSNTGKAGRKKKTGRLAAKEMDSVTVMMNASLENLKD